MRKLGVNLTASLKICVNLYVTTSYSLTSMKPAFQF